MRVAKRLPSVYEVLGSSISSAAEKKKDYKKRSLLFQAEEGGRQEDWGQVLLHFSASAGLIASILSWEKAAFPQTMNLSFSGCFCHLGFLRYPLTQLPFIPGPSPVPYLSSAPL